MNEPNCRGEGDLYSYLLDNPTLRRVVHTAANICAGCPSKVSVPCLLEPYDAHWAIAAQSIRGELRARAKEVVA